MRFSDIVTSNYFRLFKYCASTRIRTLAAITLEAEQLYVATIFFDCVNNLFD
jgi:hypothetical protein